jgi:hypothetical protein
VVSSLFVALFASVVKSTKAALVYGRSSLALRLKNRIGFIRCGERGRSDDNDARALFLSNTAEERVEALDIITNRFQFCHQRGWLREVSQPFT